MAIIGCGAITDTFYLPAIMKRRSTAINPVLVDTDEARLKYLCEKYHLDSSTTRYEDLLGKIDGAIIAVPHSLHYRISMDFLRHGTHVLCEKPLAENHIHAEEMAEQARQSGVTLSVNNTRRLYPSSIAIKELIEKGALGEIVEIEYINGYLFRWPTTSGFYFNHDHGVPKGVILDQGAHVLDLVCWWLGDKPELMAAQNDSFGGTEAMAIITLQKGQCRIRVKLSWLSQLENSFRITGKDGTIEGNIEDWNRFKITSRNGKSRMINSKSDEKSYLDFGNKLMSNFIDVIEHAADPLVSAVEVIPSIQLMEECYEMPTKLNTPWYDNLEELDER